MDSSKHKKKRRKRSHNQGDVVGASRKEGHHQPRLDRQNTKQQHHHHIDRQKRHQEALALSQQLRQLSSQKRLKECLELYQSPSNDELRDAHHGSIVVDCCARCGDVDAAEQTVFQMLQSTTKSKKTTEECAPFFWEEYKQFSYKQVPIQAWTALLKGYVHSGMMGKADSLFNHLCVAHSSKTTSGNDGENKKGKRKRDGADTGPNVRTLNTLLRGCLWTATSLNIDNGTHNKELVGGLVTAERARLLCEDVNINFDSSSYEYYISSLSQSLQCKAAEKCLQKMRCEFGVPEPNAQKQGNAQALDNVDPTNLESLVVCLVVIARGFTLLGKKDDGRRCAEEALRYIELSTTNKTSTAASSNNDKSSYNQKTTGGKKAWKDSKASSNTLEDDGRSGGRREESNRLFRSHRLSELRSEVVSLQELCSKDSNASKSVVTENASQFAQLLMTRLLYFSGGGTTGMDATKAECWDSGSRKANVQEDTRQLIHSLWHSFGLKETVERLLTGKDRELKDVFNSTITKKKSKKSKHHGLPPVLTTEMCDSLTSNVVGKASIISTDSGYIDFAQVFKPIGIVDSAASLGTLQNKSLHIELGSGSGDWACLQAELNPSDNYVTVELRADRVAQTFAKCTLHQQHSGERCMNAPLTNLCCVGSECGSFLRDRVQPGTVKTIFVNHPEPPTQTFSVENSSKSGNGANIEAEEPAHMLNTRTILTAASCLEPNGEGRLIIVTDNLIYARLICHTLVAILEKDSKLVGIYPNEVRDLRRIESFGPSSIHLFEGKPSASIGHYTPNKFEGGTSYFDRLWRTGAGKHADMRKRFIVGLRTSGGNASHVSKGVNSHRTAKPQKSNSGGKSASKKKSAEKQRRRNERRLLKKQQMAQKEKE